MMTRKDYVAIAEILSTVRRDCDEDVFNHLIEKFCDFFFEDNHNFSPNRFEMACYGNDEMVDVK